MENRISEEIIEKIRKSIDIVDIISEYVQLKKQGRNYFGLCPFHGEKTPSFSVAPDKQIYHCFGCGAGGNVISFLMELEGYSFLEAIKQLANKSNINLPEFTTDTTNSKVSKERKLILNAYEILRKLYHHILVRTNEGQHALNYLQQRGITNELISIFQLGYAPDSWELTTSFLQRRGFQLDQMEKAGLIAKRNKDGKYFDRFRNRIMFPIWNQQGEIIAFSGRALNHDNDPKYLNSPETQLFDKSKTIFAYHLARPHIRSSKQVVLMEGNIDVISSWKAGIRNSVATLGTSLTENQMMLLRRITDTVIICYDSDKAGINATFRAANMLTSADFTVKIAKLPDQLDPDDYIKLHGADRFRQDVIGAGLTVMSFKMEYYKKGKNLSEEGDRLLYIEEVLKEISKLQKAVERDHYLRQIAGEFNLSLDALKQQQYMIYRQMSKKLDNDKTNWHNNAKKNFSLQNITLRPAFENAERILIAHMIRDQEVATNVLNNIGVSFNIDEHNAIATYLYAFYEEGHRADPGLFIQKLNDEKLRSIVSELAMMPVNTEITDQELKDYINKVLDYPNWLKIDEKEKEKKEAEQRKDYLTAAEIAKDIIKMKQELKKR